ncbi:hypothetical protein MRX96_043853 [Rhipicephalus microplus]
MFFCKLASYSQRIRAPALLPIRRGKMSRYVSAAKLLSRNVASTAKKPVIERDVQTSSAIQTYSAHAKDDDILVFSTYTYSGSNFFEVIPRWQLVARDLVTWI